MPNAPVLTNLGYEKPKDLFGAISHLEVLYEAESTGTDIPDKIATIKERLDFFNLGFRSIVKGTVISILLAPLFAAVFGNHMPIFGNFDPSLFDKAIAYILSFGYSLAMIMLFIYTATLKSGRISTIIANNMLTGMTVGIVMQFFIALFVYGLAGFIVLTDGNLHALYDTLFKLHVSSKTINMINTFIMMIKNSLATAIYVFFYTSVVLVALPWSTAFIKKIINKSEDF